MNQRAGRAWHVNQDENSGVAASCPPGCTAGFSPRVTRYSLNEPAATAATPSAKGGCSSIPSTRIRRERRRSCCLCRSTCRLRTCSPRRQRRYGRIWSAGSEQRHSIRLSARHSAIDVSTVQWPGSISNGPPPTMSLIGSKLPGGAELERRAQRIPRREAEQTAPVTVARRQVRLHEDSPSPSLRGTRSPTRGPRKLRESRESRCAPVPAVRSGRTGRAGSDGRPVTARMWWRQAARTSRSFRAAGQLGFSSLWLGSWPPCS